MCLPECQNSNPEKIPEVIYNVGNIWNNIDNDDNVCMSEIAFKTHKNQDNESLSDVQQF